MGGGGGGSQKAKIYIKYIISRPKLVDTPEITQTVLPLLLTGRGDQKERWLTLGPVIRKLFTDLEEETAYSLREAQRPSQIPLIISHISH